MSLPPRAAAIYAALSNPEADGAAPPGASIRTDGTVLDDLQSTGWTRPEEQKDFYSYQTWFKNYPNDLIVKVSKGLIDSPIYPSGRNFIQIGAGSSAALEFKCPTNWVTSYNPGPPNYDPAPDPNGQTAILNDSIGAPTYIASLLPRWHTETAYDYSEDGIMYNWYSTHGWVPEKGKVYTFFPSDFNDIRDFIGSWDISVTNLLSKVLNVETGDYEYYPFTQATTEFKATAKLSIPQFWTLCCWNMGTIIKGKVAIYTADVTTSTIPESGDGFIGMSAEIGDTFNPHSEVEWEVTLEDGYTPVEIELPKVAGKVTFVNDFWITSVVPPTA